MNYIFPFFFVLEGEKVGTREAIVVALFEEERSLT
jgi:hypothetical protein